MDSGIIMVETKVGTLLIMGVQITDLRLRINPEPSNAEGERPAGSGAPLGRSSRPDELVLAFVALDEGGVDRGRLGIGVSR